MAAEIPWDDDDEGDEEAAAGNGEADGDEAGEPLILIVVGAHLRAEVGDRPIAYGLRERMIEWLDGRFGRDGNGEADEDEAEDGGRLPGHPCGVVVCSDVWYLNDAGLRVWPTVSLGGPGVNALSAYLADKLPSVLVVDDVLMVQMDPEMTELTCAVWGVNHDATVAAVDAFVERYLEGFMAAATKAWGE
jgi:hypothetical protein